MHLHAGQMDLDTFKCLSGDECIRASGRCNGVNNCHDGSDEQGCETEWGAPAVMGSQECQDPFVFDMQFRCGDNTCTHIAGRCNGVNNCADGSDEQGCATTSTALTLEAMTGFTAIIEKPAIGSEVFYDRTYTFDSLGSFTGYSMVKMSNEDKHIDHDKVQMKLRLTQPTVLYIVKLDNTELEWLAQEEWTHTTLTGVSYHGVRQTRHTEWSGELHEDHYGPGAVYQKVFTAGTVELRGNNGGDGSYVIFAANPANPAHPIEEETTVCPAGWTQVGEAGADIGGCGLQSCGERYWSESPTECADACAADRKRSGSPFKLSIAFWSALASRTEFLTMMPKKLVTARKGTAFVCVMPPIKVNHFCQLSRAAKMVLHSYVVDMSSVDSKGLSNKICISRHL